jgi:hypothetical protein
MNAHRIVDQLRTSRANRQQAEEALTNAQEVVDEAKRGSLLLKVVMHQNQAIAALEQALLATVE